MDATFREGFITAYRTLLRAMGTWGSRAVPDLGDDLSKRLTALDQQLEASGSATLLQMASKQAASDLSDWAEEANIRHNSNHREIREILAGVTTIAETLGKRDENTGREIAELAQRLHSAAENDDIAILRRSILESTEVLTACAGRIVEEGAASLARLAAEVDRYRTRLETTEALSSKDPLTGLYNRRAFDSQLDKAIRTARPFSLVMVDLNGFKAINDQHGHLIGDELLKQFADELRSQFPGATAVARWGGDEFAVILGSTLKDTQVRIQRLQRWAVGDYVIAPENARELLERADRRLYDAKQLIKVGQLV
jgi:GGDEF domain-containing protein